MWSVAALTALYWIFSLTLQEHALNSMIHNGIKELVIPAWIMCAVSDTPECVSLSLVFAMGFWYMDMQTLRSRFLVYRDHTLLRIQDFVLMGNCYAVILSRRYPQRWLYELCHAVYLSFYVVFIGVPLYLLMYSNHAELQVSFSAVLCIYYTGMVIHYLFPVQGPYNNSEIEPKGLGLVTDLVLGRGSSAGTAFPSMHCAITTAWSLALWYHGHVYLVAALAYALSMAFASVYTCNHYVVDAVAGNALALFVSWIYLV